MLAQFTNLKDKLFMKTEIRITAEMTDEQCEVLLSELINTSEIIGIKLEVESSKLSQHEVSKSVRIEALETAIAKETDFQSKWHLQEILRITKYGLPKTAPYIPMMP